MAKTLYTHIKLLFFIVLMGISIVSSSQSNFASSEELEAQAQEYFENEQYVKAFPLYSQLLSLDKTNPELQYRFGVCLLYSDRSDTYAPIKHLKKAIDHVATPDIYYHLGFAHHINYNFPAAISFYNQYLAKAGKKVKKTFDAKRKIEMCNNGMGMMRSVKDLFVLDKTEVKRQEFYRSYELNEYGGKMIQKPEEFLSKEDLKNKEKDFLFFNAESPEVYYAAYGKEHKKQKDIYKRVKNPEGGWSAPIRLSEMINTPYDDDFPVLMPDGKTLYFSSKGHNTIGGYDIFKTIYNEETKNWTTPVNINFPFNTPVDDILFVPDTLESTAWFASVRNSVDEKIMVYRVGILKRPDGSEDLAAIYAKNQELTEADLRAIKNRAKLDVNISQQDFENIEETEVDLISQAQQIHKENVSQISAEIAQKEQEQLIIDSAKYIVNRLEENIDSFDSLRQQALSISANKRLESKRIKEDVKSSLKLAATSTDLDGINKAVKTANKNLAYAERLDFEALELEDFAKDIKGNIENQRETFVDINARYGDAEQAVVSKNPSRARAIISGMNGVMERLPDIEEYNSLIVSTTEPLNISYPNELSEENFQAFVVNTQNISPQIESFDARYDEYIPKMEFKEITSLETGYSNNPSARLQEYINTLYDVTQSIDVQINEYTNHTAEISAGFASLPSNEKQQVIEEINELEETKAELISQKAWMGAEIREKQEELNALQLSSQDVDEKMQAYQDLNSDLETHFDFDKKIFKPNNPIAFAAPIVSYSMNNAGNLEKQSKQKEMIVSSEMDYSSGSNQVIEQQSTQMLSETRTLLKENQFLIRKLDNTIREQEALAKESLTQANQLLRAARSATGSSKETALNQVNTKFAETVKQTQDLQTLKETRGSLQTSVIDQENLIADIEDKYADLQDALARQNYDNVRVLYENIEKSYRNNKTMADYSAEIDYESAELISNENTEYFSEDVYQMTANGDIVKTFGSTSADWNSLENFSNDLENPTEVALVLSPNINLHTRQSLFTDIFSPQEINTEEQIQAVDVQIPAEIVSSDNSLLKNSVNQIQSLENQLNSLTNTRNVLYNYYEKQLSKAEDFEAKALQHLNGSTVQTESLQLANQEAVKSKEELYKASVAASIIRQYDAKIEAYSALIEKTLVTSDEMLDLIEEGNQDEALLKNVQLQRDIAAANDIQVDDSKFNYAVGEVFAEIPDRVYESENAEFVNIDGKIQRNDQAKISQMFYQEAYPVKTNILASPLIVATTATAIAQSTNNAGDLSDNATSQSNSSFQNTESATNNSLTGNQMNAADNASSGQNGANIAIANKSNPLDTQNSQSANSAIPNSENTSSNITNPQNNIAPNFASEEFVSLQSYTPQNFNNVDDFRGALSSLNSYAQNHMVVINQNTSSLISLAEAKLNKSNEFSLKAENSSGAEKRQALDSAKVYLYQAMSIKALAEDYDDYAEIERGKQEQITQATFNIESLLVNNNISNAQQEFLNLQKTTSDFEGNPVEKIEQLAILMQNSNRSIQAKMDSAYNVSQVLANKSVQLLTEAGEEREKAEGKRNAFKRRESLRIAEEKEIEATRLQNESEKALEIGNQYYQDKEIITALSGVYAEVINMKPDVLTDVEPIVGQELVFENIETRKAEVIDGQLSTAVENKPETTSQAPQLAQTDDIHVYQRENFKAEMISEELGLLKREIALLVQSQNASLPEREQYIIDKKISLLRQKADSLDYEANKAFEFANRVLESLSAEEKQMAQESGRDFESYLSELKGKIEILLSEAASLKQRAQRSNNIETREDLFYQAKEKEEVAMYLILEEFEVIAQKNRTRYRRNQLILQQLLLDQASAEERELMRNIFAQIDGYFAEGDAKRMKANESGTSFNMKKILLQDAYSLEMKALDLQQQAKNMIENHDKISMMAYQSEPEETPTETTTIAANTTETTNNPNQNNTAETIIQNNSNQQQTPPIEETIIAENIPLVDDSNEDGIYYRVQFVALKELKNTNSFNQINEVAAEAVPGTDYYRYYSGRFSDFDNALIRRNSIRASGYPDAFIKSWNNGEEANLLSLSEESPSQTTPEISITSETQVNNIDFSATNISSLQGVYYTVQIGVYSRPRTSAMIFGITPLYHKRMNNGFWIYYSGIFKSIANAEIKKEEIRSMGVSDAFVVAFGNGTQIDLAQARMQISRGEETPSDDAIVILQDASFEIDQKWNANQQNTVNIEDVRNDELVYKVQVGVYSNPINLSWMSSQLENNNIVESYENANGKHVYTMGNFSNEDDARALLNEIADFVPDAFLVGFQNGQKKYIR